MRPGLTVPRWPGSYVTARVRVLFDVWRQSRRFPPRTDGLLHWPAPLVEALSALDTEAAIGGAHGRNPD